MKLPFRYKDIHECQAVVINCIDFRFWREVVQYVDKEFGLSSYDLICWPGGAKPINERYKDNSLVQQCLSVPYNLHKIKNVIIVNHRDCGAYDGSTVFHNNRDNERDFHIIELHKAQNLLQDIYPKAKIILAYADVDDNQEYIEINQI